MPPELGDDAPAQCAIAAIANAFNAVRKLGGPPCVHLSAIEPSGLIASST